MSATTKNLTGESKDDDAELSVEIFKKFCQDKQREENKIVPVGTEDSLTNGLAEQYLITFSDSLMQFGNLLTCDLVVQHMGRQYVSFEYIFY